ncbi:MAG: hypothetical protein AB1403_10885 [Candidatus Riflebacteria bacterium]
MGKPLIESLLNVRWPCTKLSVAVDLNCSLEYANKVLWSAKERGWVTQSLKHYIPAEKLLDAWIEARLL